jgi:16S rRNA (uracil1498-N3)-methyltransferase
MALPCFYHPDLQDNSLVSLSREESSHALKSRRLKVGDKLLLIDGAGYSAEAEIKVCERSRVTVLIGTVSKEAHRTKQLTMALSLPKGDRAKTMIDMLTQVGVDEFVFLKCERSITKLTSNLLNKLERAAKESCKQSHRADFPVFHSQELSVQNLLERYTDSHAIYLADQFADDKAADLDDRNEVMLIGPEGGFSCEEITAILENKAIRVALGKNILRTETAAIAGAALLLNRSS